jgi:hypothetical protein
MDAVLCNVIIIPQEHANTIQEAVGADAQGRQRPGLDGFVMQR